MNTSDEVRRDWDRPGYDTEPTSTEVELRRELGSAKARILECERSVAVLDELRVRLSDDTLAAKFRTISEYRAALLLRTSLLATASQEEVLMHWSASSGWEARP